jgi:prolipoprotein diacylglyceryl transferase
VRSVATVLPAYFPSPPQGVWHLGPVPIRAYALCIITGVIVATVWGDRRWKARVGWPGLIGDVTIWAVPTGLVGARLYNVITDPELYFPRGKNPWNAFAVWHGGLGIWGGIAGGVLGAAYACHRYDARLCDVAWVLAPVLPVAQAIGRFGNYFNQELYGRPSTLPWALRIDPAHRPPATPLFATYQPTFAYEALWDLGVSALVLWAQRRYKLTGWRSFALYAAAYTAGRGWIEALRDDPANRILGVRVNDWASFIVFTIAVICLWRSRNAGQDLAGRDGSGGALSADVAGPADTAPSPVTSSRTGPRDP